MDIDLLYNRAITGDLDSENKLFQSLTAKFHYLAKLKIRDDMDAEEVAQESLATIIKKYKEIKIETSFTAWVQRILELDIMNYYKKAGRRKRILNKEYAGDNAEPVLNPDPFLWQKLKECLGKINNINVRHARILNLIQLGFNLDTIAEKLGITLKNTYSTLYRARVMLAKCLETGDPIK